MQDAIGFDNDRYLQEQSAAILDRVGRFGNKLYLEFGGKLLFDYHAARVLPGFDPNVKMRLLTRLKDKAEILLCIHAGAIERKKMRADFGITYDADAMKLIDDLRDWGIELRGVVFTRFDEQPAAVQFHNKLRRRDIPVCTHQPTKGYPADVDRIVSAEGYGANPYVETAINYNRDVEAFPVLHKILERITGDEPIYRSPTEMGVNRASAGIVDDAVVRDAARAEVIRRYFRYSSEYVMGLADERTVQRVERLMEVLHIEPEDRKVVEPARRAAEEAQQQGKGNNGVFCGAAVRLKGGTIVAGKNSPLMHAASSLVINAVKRLAGVPAEIHLLPPGIIESAARMKKDVLGQKAVSLDLAETLFALGVSVGANPMAQLCVEKLKARGGSSMGPWPVDEQHGPLARG